jgi:uncharacterized protein
MSRTLIARLGSALLICCALFFAVGSAAALSALDFPETPPPTHLIDEADVLSRATRADLEKRLKEFEEAHLQADLVTLRRLDYDLSLDDLGDQLLQRWQGDESGQLVLLIESATNSASIRADQQALKLLPLDLLTSTADTTMTLPLRDGARYRQAVLDGLQRLSTVLAGGEDPGPPLVAEALPVVSNIPSQEDTAGSNAFTWVIVLLVIGTVVPMATWWVFSR